jgi:CRISPR-associated protein Cas1
MSGYNPSIGFIHSYKTLSFVYDIADLYKFELSVPVAFEYIAAYNAGEKVSLKQMFIKKVNDCNFTSSVISKINKLFDGHNQTT